MDRNLLPVYGIDNDISKKFQAKYDKQTEQDALEWIQEVVGHPIGQSGQSLQAILKDGIILCELMNRLAPQSCVVSHRHMPFNQMENINQFLTAAQRCLGVPPTDLFTTVELYENRNMLQVITGIYAVARHAQAKNLNCPSLGPKLSDKHQVNFDPKVLAQGNAIISLQAGFNGGANQSGMSYGSFRQIDSKVDPGASVPSNHTSGYSKGANQSGMSYGAFRQIDSHTGAGAAGPTSFQAGYNKGANASGVIYGLPRQIGGNDPLRASQANHGSEHVGH